MHTSRRRLLSHAVLGSGLLALRSLASGIPIAFLAEPRRALAASGDPQAADFKNPQFLIMNTSQAGDPLNCNAPGTYLDSKIAHPADPRLAKTRIDIGGAAWDAAAPWATLGALSKAPKLFERTSFIHHNTGTEQHLQEPDVLQLMGTVANKDMAVSAFAAQLAPILGTIQAQPVTIGTVDSSEAISFRGRPQPLLNPQSLNQVLGAPTGPLGQLQKLRDQDLNRLNAFFKENGTTAQRNFLDQYATSQSQVRQIASNLLSRLATIKDNSADSQMQAAIVLIQMKIAPVVTVHIPFGGDNHFDGTLQQESDQTVTGMATICNLVNGLADADLSDAVTFASMNVFGRTLTMQGAGRSHNRNHHLTLLIGKNVKGSVIGGVTPMNGDYGALPINSKTGKGESSGDIALVDSLTSVGKTLGVALGIPKATVDRTIVFASTGAPAGTVIAPALVG
jgi:hypothetical protein